MSSSQRNTWYFSVIRRKNMWIYGQQILHPSERACSSEYSEVARRAEITLLEAIFEGLNMERESIDQILDKHG
ncbi:hypothetical protein D5086_014473 [Populus alba]|uniref:Uncharacterized protein n=1 Tax=Populus alba TaxID=43335 RepID=A0ACC4BY60_POPAL